ncbi:cytochrome P450 [Chlamydoabsidia padenii]|nr:cytochrome P450 [Chlamydoabsidia padenii]
MSIFMLTDGANTLVLVGSIIVIVLTTLALKYNDRVVFDTIRPYTTHFKGWPLIGSTLTLVTSLDRMHHFHLAAFESTGATNISISAIGYPRGVTTVDPTTIEHILKFNFENYIKGSLFHYAVSPLLGHGIFNANGERWRYQRKTAAIIFNVKNLRDYFTDVFVKELALVCDIFDKAMTTKTVVDFHDIMYKFTLDSFVLLGFGTQVNALTTKGKVPFAESFDELQKNVFDRSINIMEPINRHLQQLFMPWKPTIASHQKVVNDFAASVIHQRRSQLAKGQTHKDLLSRFMETKNEKDEPLSDTELRDAIMNLTVAGRDTTAQTLAWLLYNLMLNPDIEEKLVQEIHDHVPDGLEQDSPALYEAIKKLNFGHAVLYETLRLYPSVPLNQKEALKDDVLPCGIQIKAGDVVMWSSYSLGRNKTVWGDDATEFKPERWITKSGDVRRESQGRWPAFHVGPRVCLGQNLATLEALVTLSILLKRYKFTMVPNQDITYQVSISLPMKHGLKVTIDPRS